MKKKITIELFTTDDQLIIEKDLSTKIAKGFANIKRIDELEYNAYANVELNDNIIESVKAYMRLKNITEAVLYVTNDYCESIDLFKLSL